VGSTLRALAHPTIFQRHKQPRSPEPEPAAWFVVIARAVGHRGSPMLARDARSITAPRLIKPALKVRLAKQRALAHRGELEDNWRRGRGREIEAIGAPARDAVTRYSSFLASSLEGNTSIMKIFRLPIILLALVVTTPAFAARCGGDFNSFLASMSADAQAAGISQGVIGEAFAGVTEDGAVLNFDRRQRYTFNKTFEQYVSTRVGSGRINGGRAMLARNAALLSRIEQRFGVPRQILVAIWGLETDFGKGDMGRLPVIRTLATLAHDCRRSELFQGELLAALKIVQRGDLPLHDLIGAFAGEIGQTQFLPSSYIKYGVDFDGDGRVDLRHSVADVLASTANLLHTNGFKMGEPYGEGSANFEAMREWNHAEIYRKTIGYFADQLVGR
jgi:lytic murein transglycosylase